MAASTMSDFTRGDDTPARSFSKVILTAVAISLAVTYTLAVYVQPPKWWPDTVIEGRASLVRGLYTVINGALSQLGISSPSPELRTGVYLVLTAGIIPWLLMAVIRRGRPSDLGIRRPNRIGWRLLVVGCLLAAPIQYWMVLSPAFAKYYEPQLNRAGLTAFIGFYVVNMLTEHLFLHGILLGACRVGQRWPPPPPVAADAEGRWGRIGQWLGLAQPCADRHGPARLIGWIGLPPGCIPAVITSASLFGMIHLGKDPREMLLSIPGGIALAYIAYRGNTWLIPYFLHLATAGTALALMMVVN
jgi:hypothetical protein